MEEEEEEDEEKEEEEDDGREAGETRRGVRWERVEGIAEYLERRTRLGLGGGCEDMWLLLCEFANFAVVVASLILTNVFLGGKFWQFGTEAVQWQWQEEQERVDPLSRVFPKMTKCEIYETNEKALQASIFHCANPRKFTCSTIVWKKIPTQASPRCT